MNTAELTTATVRPACDASISTDASCRTPCSLAVPVADAFTVSYALSGYLPQTVPVRPLPGESGPFGSSGTATQFDPNPVFAALQPATPSKPPPPKKRKRPTTAAVPPPAAPPNGCAACWLVYFSFAIRQRLAYQEQFPAHVCGTDFAAFLMRCASPRIGLSLPLREWLWSGAVPEWASRIRRWVRHHRQ
jgi:hypothetical protein